MVDANAVRLDEALDIVYDDFCLLELSSRRAEEQFKEVRARSRRLSDLIAVWMLLREVLVELLLFE